MKIDVKTVAAWSSLNDTVFDFLSTNCRNIECSHVEDYRLHKEDKGKCLNCMGAVDNRIPDKICKSIPIIEDYHNDKS